MGWGKKQQSSTTKALAFSVAFTCYRKWNKTETDPTFQHHFKPIPKQNAPQLLPKKCCRENATQGVSPDIGHLPIALCSTYCTTFHNHANITLATQPAFYSLLTLIQATSSARINHHCFISVRADTVNYLPEDALRCMLKGSRDKHILNYWKGNLVIGKK